MNGLLLTVLCWAPDGRELIFEPYLEASLPWHLHFLMMSSHFEHCVILHFGVKKLYELITIRCCC